MRRQALWLGLAACVLCCVTAYSQVPWPGPLSAESAIARRLDNLVLVNGRPTVLLWARGLERAEDLDRYAETGFNTAYVVVAGGSEEQLSRAVSLASQAEERGLLVVAGLAPGPLRDAEGNELAIDPTSEAYASAVGEFVDSVVGQMGSRPRLIAWSVEAVPSSRMAWGDLGLRAYLQDWYGSLAELNRSWGTSFADWQQISFLRARDVDALRPGGLGRASVDVAFYRAEAYADALAIWAEALRAADPGRLVFASALTDYRSIISVRTDFDGLVLNTYPSLAEADWQTHNVHAVDIARQANRFAAIPTLEVEGQVNANRVAAWVNASLLHGAAGVALSSWPPVRDSEPLSAMVRQTAEALAASDAFPAQPRPHTAIIYEPLAGGALRNGQGLYGYLDGVTPNEPTQLFGVARSGSRFGQFDVLSASGLPATDLSQYGAIIAPMAFYLPEEVQLALYSFALRGGALVVDAGVGMYQAAGTVVSVPQLMRELLGLRYADLSEPNRYRASPELGEPGQPGGPGQTGIAVPVGPGEVGGAVDPAIMQMAAAMEELLSTPDVETYLGRSFAGPEGPGFRVRGLGRGFAVYAPTFLYQNWGPADPYFAEFHARILSQGSELEVIEPAGLWPAVAAAAYADGSVAVASPNGIATAVVVYGRENRVYSVPAGAMRLANPETDARAELLFPGAPLTVAQPLPILLQPVAPDDVVTVSVLRYGADGVELLVHGSGAVVTPTRTGLEPRGGSLTSVQIVVRDGLYRVSPGSTHRAVLEEVGGRGQRWEQSFMPNPETGALVIPIRVGRGRLTITPVPE